jgi:hypothetical protein
MHTGPRHDSPQESAVTQRPAPLCRRPSAVVVLLAACLSGCLQLETTVTLHEDGSATITERLQFAKRLLEYRDPKHPDQNIGRLLGKPAVLDRMKHMGKGIKLVRHAIRDGAKGSRESIAVFKIPAVEDFRYVSPFIGKADYSKHKGLVCRIRPLFGDSWTGRRAGHMELGFYSETKGQGDVAYKPASPADRQLYRQLHPMFADMLRDFELKFIFESYAPAIVHSRAGRSGQRARGTRTHRTYLIDVSGENLDRYGARFIANEEAMADLLQMRINGGHVRANCGFGNTSQLFRFLNGGCEVMFRPSRHYFDKYFKGKTVNYDLGFGKRDKRKADFKKDGYHGE